MDSVSLAAWSAEAKEKGLLLFAEGMYELFCHRSHDSYKVPTQNFSSIWKDLKVTLKLINNDVLDAGNIIPFLDELKDFFDNDIISKELFSNNYQDIYQIKDEYGVYKPVYETIMKNKTSDATRAILNDVSTYMKSHMSMNYYDKLKNKIRELISINITYDKAVELNSLVRSFESELINRGYSQEYIFRCVNDKFFSSKAVSNHSGAYDTFVNIFTGEENDYTVYFPVTFSSIPLLIKYQIDYAYNLFGMFGYRTQYVGKFKLSALDPYSAMQMVIDIFDIIYSMVEFEVHNSKRIKFLAVEVVGSDGTHHIKTSLEPIKRARSYDDINLLVLGLKASSTGKILEALKLHSSALKSESIPNQLLNLWTIMEIIIPTQKKHSYSRINQISNHLTTAVCSSYFRSILEYIVDDLYVQSEAFRVYSDANNGVKKYKLLVDILATGKLSGLLTQIIENLVEYPIIRYKLEYLKSVIVNGSMMKKVYTNHSNRVRQQIMRIYRNRNMIIHDGVESGYSALIVQNLHYYADVLIDVICKYSTMGYTDMTSILFELSRRELNNLKTMETTKILSAEDIRKLIENSN